MVLSLGGGLGVFHSKICGKCNGYRAINKARIYIFHGCLVGHFNFPGTFEHIARTDSKISFQRLCCLYGSRGDDGAFLSTKSMERLFGYG